MSLENRYHDDTGYKSRGSERFIAIDQIRGLAIAAMIMAHFGPGFYERIGLDGFLLDFLNVTGRFATPTFIAIFGFSIAFAYLPKAVIDPGAVRRRLIRRSLTVLFCAILVSLPQFVKSLFSEESWGGSEILDFLISIYGILFFYFLAILSAALIIPFISNRFYGVSAVVGATFVMIGTYLGYDAWPQGAPGFMEWLRLVLVSGKFAYFVNFGFTLMLVPLGAYIYNMHKNGQNLNFYIFTAGLVLLFCSLSIGRILGWRTLAELYTSYDAPPQLWYLCMIAGTMLLLMTLLNTITFPVISFLLEHTGKNPLSIYVAHAFVLPIVDFIKYVQPSISEGIAITIPVLAFFLYWIYVIIKSAGVVPSTRSTST